MNVLQINQYVQYILTGAGKGFSAGQDLAEAADPNGPGLKKYYQNNLIL